MTMEVCTCKIVFFSFLAKSKWVKTYPSEPILICTEVFVFSDKPTTHKWDKKKKDGVGVGERWGVLPGKTTDQEEESVCVFSNIIFILSKISLFLQSSRAITAVTR